MNYLEQVASILANGDQEIGTIIASAVQVAGKHGVIVIEEPQSMQTRLETVDGIQFDRGYISTEFVTDAERQEAVLISPYVLFYEEKIGSMKDLLPILEQVARMGEPLLIIAGDVEGEALATLIVNKQHATLNVVAVRALGFGDPARPCWATSPSSQVARQSRKTWVSSWKAVRRARPRLKRKRLAWMMHATRAAMEEGLLPGGGVALLQAGHAATDSKFVGGEEIGAKLLRTACEAPFREIVLSAGEDPEQAILKALGSSNRNFGLNVSANEWQDLRAAEVIDPLKTTRTALYLAISESLSFRMRRGITVASHLETPPIVIGCERIGPTRYLG